MCVSSVCLQSVNISRLMVSALGSVSAELHLELTHWNNAHSETQTHAIHTLPLPSVRLVGGWTFDLRDSSNTNTLTHTPLLPQWKAAGEKIWTHSEPFFSFCWKPIRPEIRRQMFTAAANPALVLTLIYDRGIGQGQRLKSAWHWTHVSASAGQITSNHPERTEEEWDEGWLQQLRFKFSQRRSVSLSWGETY